MLSPRQQFLLDEILPRLRFPLEAAADPLSAFSPRPARLWMEIGYGSGEHTEGLLDAHPEIGLIACEVFANGIASLAGRLVPEGQEAHLPARLRLWDDDARIVLRALPDGALDALFLMFPDPWPKARHAKRRFVHPLALPGIARALRPGGMWRIASDDPTYQAWVGETLAAQDLFDAPPPATSRPEGWPPTRYEAKALLAGRSPLYWTLRRR